MALDWKLTVWPATGGASREILRDVSFVLGGNGRGLRLQVTPEGECREAVFSAKGAGIQLAPLSAVQVSYLHLGIWTPIFFGEVRRGGNARDVFGEDYALRGMSRRLEEVTLSPGFSAPEQAAHLTVRAIIQDVIASGQLGTPALVQYVESLCPDLGFNCRRIVDAAQQNPAALLKQISEDGARYGVLVRWGVDPQRRFFCRPAKSDTRDVTTEAPVIQWAPPVAETPCTAVLWYVARKADGTPLTHLSRSAQADVYGDRILPLSVQSDLNPWTPVPGTWAWVGYDGAGRYVPLDPQPAAPDTATLTDGKASTPDPNVTQNLPVTSGGLLFIAASPARRITYTGRAVSNAPGGASEVSTMIAVPDSTGLVSTRVIAEPGAGWGVGTSTLNQPASRFVFVNTGALGDATDTTFTFTEFRAEVIDAEMLDGLAEFHYSSPAQEPADIETVLFVPPVELPGRVRVMPADGVPYEHPLEAVEYRISDKGMLMGWLAGQADDPNALAQASLIKRRDGEAVITAVTAQT